MLGSLSRKIIGSTSTVVTGLFIEDMVEPSYKMTVGSVVKAGIIVGIPAALGLVKVRLPVPEKFNVENREHLRHSEPHVSNVNVVMDYLGLPITMGTVKLIQHQENSRHKPGSPHDRAYEHRIARSFLDEYSSHTQTIAEIQAMSLDQHQDIRLKQAFDYTGGIAHTAFGIQKRFLYNLSYPELNKIDQIDRHEHDKAKYKVKNNELKKISSQTESHNTEDYKDRLSIMRTEGQVKDEVKEHRQLKR